MQLDIHIQRLFWVEISFSLVQIRPIILHSTHSYDFNRTFIKAMFFSIMLKISQILIGFIYTLTLIWVENNLTRPATENHRSQFQKSVPSQSLIFTAEKFCLCLFHRNHWNWFWAQWNGIKWIHGFFMRLDYLNEIKWLQKLRNRLQTHLTSA